MGGGNCKTRGRFCVKSEVFSRRREEGSTEKGKTCKDNGGEGILQKRRGELKRGNLMSHGGATRRKGGEGLKRKKGRKHSAKRGQREKNGTHEKSKTSGGKLRGNCHPKEEWGSGISKEEVKGKRDEIREEGPGERFVAQKTSKGGG